MKNVSDYLVARSPDEAVRLLRDTVGVGCYLAGATDLLLEDRPELDYVVDLRRAGLDEVDLDGNGDLHLGACVTLRTLETDPRIRDFAGGAVSAVAAACGNRPVRSTATLGGNLCSALPSGDMAPVLLALDAVAHVCDGAGTIDVPLREFFLGPRTTMLGDRLLVGITLPAASADLVCLSRKLTRTAEDIALVQVSVALRLEHGAPAHAAVALGAVAPVPLRALAAEQMLCSADAGELEDAAVAAAQAAADACDPISDRRAGADYRRAMVETLCRRLILEAAGFEIAPSAHHPGGAA